MYYIEIYTCAYTHKGQHEGAVYLEVKGVRYILDIFLDI